MNILQFQRTILLGILIALPIFTQITNAQPPNTPICPDSVIPSKVSFRSLNDDYRSTLPSYIPSSPTVSSLITYADYPVSHYTGVPDISIPLYEINIDNYKLPIFLSYHASGIRVNQEASWVGLGWALNAGGVISRTIKCADDFLEQTPPGSNINQGYYSGPEANNPYDNQYYTTVGGEGIAKSALLIDSEPDIFSYSLPNASGKFVLDKSRGPVLFNKGDNIKIEVLPDGAKKKYFKLTTPDGVQYLFNQYETTRSYGRQGVLNYNLSNATKFDEYESTLNSIYDSPLTYTSSWYLSQIKTSTNRIITFNYETESYQAPVQESCVKYNVTSFSGSLCGPGNNVIYSCSKTVIDNLRLSSISWNSGRIEFNCTSREDMIGLSASPSPQRLSTLRIYDNANTCIKSYQFDYEYFNNSYTGSYKQVFKRLKLSKLSDSNDTTFNYKFSYNEGNLPAKNSKNTDYWGYYNGISQNSSYYCTAKYNNAVYAGANKHSQLSSMKIGSLRSIRYPTNKTIELTYEANQYWPDGPSTSTSIETMKKGFNVYNYYQDDVDSQFPPYECDTIVLETVTSFKLGGWAESWGCKPDPDIMYNNDVDYPTFRITRLYSSGNNNIVLAYPVPGELQHSCSYDFPQRTISLAAGTYIFEAFAPAKDVRFAFSYEYDKVVTQVKEPVSGGGLRISHISGEKDRSFTYPIGKLLIEPAVSYTANYSCLNGTATLSNTSYIVQISDPTIPMYTLKHGNSIGYDSVQESAINGSTTYSFYNEKEEQTDDYPFLSTEINYYNGLPKSISYSKGNTEGKRIEYDYSAIYSQNIYGFMFNSGGVDVHLYKYRITWPHKTKEKITDNEDNGNIITEKIYTYNNNLQLKTESVTSRGDSYMKKISYPTDLTDAVSQSMVGKHIISTPVEVVALKNGNVIMGKKTIYKDTLSMFLPKEEQIIETKALLPADNYQNAFSPQLEFSSYNQWGRPMQISDRSSSVVYLWSYNGMYPIAEIKNASYQQVLQKLSAGFISNLCNKTVPTTSDLLSINGLRDSLPYAHITTFTYKPLVGITSVTDARNLTTYYTYDSSGRLSEIYLQKNGAQQIIEKYDYHYYNK